MTQRFEFELIGTNTGYCHADYRRKMIYKDGTEGENLYCILEHEGPHTMTSYGEPNTPLAKSALSHCYFQRVPDRDPTAKNVNAWIENHTGGFLPDDHSFSVTDLREKA